MSNFFTGDAKDHIFNTKAIEKLGKTLVKLASNLPTWLVIKTPFMVTVFRVIIFLNNTTSKIQKELVTNSKVAKLLQLHESQYNMPGLEWIERKSFQFPIVLATWEQQMEYFSERRPVQVVSQMIAQIDHIFSRRQLPPTILPSSRLLWWLRNTLLNSPVHWYLTRITNETESSECLQMDFSSICNTIEHDSSDCKYNIRDIRLTGDYLLQVNTLSQLSSVKTLSVSEEDIDRCHLEHMTFLTLTLIQQANQAFYHNWVHFYFNDLVLINIQNHFPRGHWVRHLMDPHMRYQNVLNNAGFFSHVPNDSRPNEVFDDILFGANLTSWSLDNFQVNIIDRTLGYYQKANFSPASADACRLNFNLNKLNVLFEEGIGNFISKFNCMVTTFVGEVIKQCTSKNDTCLMGLVNDNVLKFLHNSCLEGINPADNNIQVIFKLILSRYILQAGILHGLEHFGMYFWLSPLCLPQRIRKIFDPYLDLEDYSYPIDKQNGFFGNEMFTRYIPNKDNLWNWQTLEYGFEEPTLKEVSLRFVESVQEVILDYDTQILKPARVVLTMHGSLSRIVVCLLLVGLDVPSVCNQDYLLLSRI